MSGVVDPELLYTKQNCIGMLLTAVLVPMLNTYFLQAAVALERSTKGELSKTSPNLYRWQTNVIQC
jgi:hypothetical protein